MIQRNILLLVVVFALAACGADDSGSSAMDKIGGAAKSAGEAASDMSKDALDTVVDVADEAADVVMDVADSAADAAVVAVKR